jgi:hypothetical protein
MNGLCIAIVTTDNITPLTSNAAKYDGCTKIPTLILDAGD